jgi:hypothetical protein
MDREGLATLAEQAIIAIGNFRNGLLASPAKATHRLFVVELKVGSDEPRDIGSWDLPNVGNVETTLAEVEIDDQRDNPGGGPYPVWHYVTLMVRVPSVDVAVIGEPKDWSWRQGLRLSDDECVEGCEQREVDAPLLLAILDRTDGDGGVAEAVAAALTGRHRFQHPEDPEGTLRSTAEHILGEVAAMLAGELTLHEPATVNRVQPVTEAMWQLDEELAGRSRT